MSNKKEFIITVGREQSGSEYYPINRKYSMIKDHSRRYHNCIGILAQLEKCARLLLDYLVENMDSGNVVTSNKYMRSRFIEFIGQCSFGKVSYGDSTVEKAFKELRSHNLIIKKTRGVFMVNPEYFMKNDDRTREKMIREMYRYKPDPSDAGGFKPPKEIINFE